MQLYANMSKYLIISLVFFLYALCNFIILSNTSAWKIQHPDCICFSKCDVNLVKI